VIHVTPQAKKEAKKRQSTLDYRKLSVKVLFTDKWCCFTSADKWADRAAYSLRQVKDDKP
jgi:hypothetical protein